MDEISKFFKGLYYQFLLRDVVAKVIPGLLPLLPLILMNESISRGGIFGEISGGLPGTGSSLVTAIILYGLGMMLGTLFQFIGNRTYTFGKRNVDWGPKTVTIRTRSFKLPHIKFSLPAVDWTPIVIHVWGSEEESIKKELEFLHYANLAENRDYLLDKRDRLVVFKEMAGNYAAVFSLTFVIALITWIIYVFRDTDFFNINIIILLAFFWVIVMVLSRQNKALANQQKTWEKIVIASKGKLPTTSTASAAKSATRK